MNTHPTSIQPKSRILLFGLVLLLVAGLAACGSKDAAEVVEVPPEAIALPTDAPAEPTAAPPTAAPPTAEPPTAAPPTAEPTATPPAPVIEQVALQGECNINPYFPIVDGRVMTYHTNSGEPGEEEYTNTFTNVTNSSFTLTTDVGDGHVIAVDWQCLADGLLSPQLNQLLEGMEGIEGMEGLEFEFVDATGISIPSGDQFTVGKTWPTHYVATANMSIEGMPAMTMTQTFDTTNTVTGIESISVPAGDFPNAMVVETRTKVSFVMNAGGISQPGMAMEMSYLSWYVEGVGLVRQEFTDMVGMLGNEPYLTQLVSIQ